MPTDESYFITGIGTDVGKTIISAIFVKALNAHYWKPIQCGDLDDSDSQKVRSLAGTSLIVPSSYQFREPCSPHAAARMEDVTISLGKIKSDRPAEKTIIEGAGGLLVPINDQEDIIDLITLLNSPVVLVVKFYLGCINHTLLSINELNRRHVKILGIVFNGEMNTESKNIILMRSKLPNLLEIAEEEQITPQKINEYALILRKRMYEL
jgi:dethiobiotin synthetase